MFGDFSPQKAAILARNWRGRRPAVMSTFARDGLKHLTNGV
jgi:hypothetical protein